MFKYQNRTRKKIWWLELLLSIFWLYVQNYIKGILCLFSSILLSRIDCLFNSLYIHLRQLFWVIFKYSTYKTIPLWCMSAQAQCTRAIDRNVNNQQRRIRRRRRSECVVWRVFLLLVKTHNSKTKRIEIKKNIRQKSGVYRAHISKYNRLI